MKKFLKRKNDGSIILEAALILPIFISLILLLIVFIRISAVQIALNNTAYEVTKQVATHMYPLDLMYGDFSNTEFGNMVNSELTDIEEAKEFIDTIEDILLENNQHLPSEISILIDLKQELEKGAVEVYDSLLIKIFQPIVNYYADENYLNLDYLYITKVDLPDLKNRDDLYFGLELRYDMPLNVPFFNKVVTFKEASYEKVWVLSDISYSYYDDELEDDSLYDDEDKDDGDNEDDEDSEETKLIIDSINSPVQRGHKVRILVRGEPNATANIEIQYQSGFVKEMNFRFGSDGWLQADIIIGGHSNEGIYDVIVTSNGQTAIGKFEVLSKDNMEDYLNH